MKSLSAWSGRARRSRTSRRDIGPSAARYANPLSRATVTLERIDRGVDYKGSGSLVAIARGVVTEVASGASARWMDGADVEHKITQPGPLFRRSVYDAEGVTPDEKISTAAGKASFDLTQRLG